MYVYNCVIMYHIFLNLHMDARSQKSFPHVGDVALNEPQLLGWRLCTQYTMVELPLPADFPTWKSRCFAVVSSWLHSEKWTLGSFGSTWPFIKMESDSKIIGSKISIYNYIYISYYHSLYHIYISLMPDATWCNDDVRHLAHSYRFALPACPSSQGHPGAPMGTRSIAPRAARFLSYWPTNNGDFPIKNGKNCVSPKKCDVPIAACVFFFV